MDYDQKSLGNVHLREEIFHFCKTESAVLSGKPTIIEAIRHADLFDSLFKTQSTWLAGIVWLKAVFGLEMGQGGQPTKFELVISKDG